MNYFYEINLRLNLFKNSLRNLLKNNDQNKNKKFRIIGRVSMDSITIDISNHSNALKNGLLISCIPYIYLLIVGTFAAGTEQERILYTGFVVNILFLIILLRQNRN